MRAIKENNNNAFMLIILLIALLAFTLFILIYSQNSFRAECINNGGQLYLIENGLIVCNK